MLPTPPWPKPETPFYFIFDTISGKQFYLFLFNFMSQEMLCLK